jgi:hypothetical protein
MKLMADGPPTNNIIGKKECSQECILSLNMLTNQQQNKQEC